MSVVVRPAAAHDLHAIMALRRMWAEETDGPANDADYELRFREWFERTLPTRRAWVALAGDVAVGMMSMGLFERMPKPGRPQTYWGYLSNAFVAPDYRNAGVGRMLIDALLAHARDEGYARVVLHPSDRAIPFYHRAGFTPADMLLVQEF
jgi:GNAT superfamily N-acetyltransferase